jgi:hypothetical protein
VFAERMFKRKISPVPSSSEMPEILFVTGQTRMFLRSSLPERGIR